MNGSGSVRFGALGVPRSICSGFRLGYPVELRDGISGGAGAGMHDQ